MDSFAPTPRRGFLTRLAGAAAAFTAAGALPRLAAAQSQASPHDQWLTGLTGQHRCFFDFPSHGDGVPLIHILNYLATYRSAYGAQPGTVNAVGTLYGAPTGPASIPLGWNDLVWQKYRIGDLLKLNDPETRAPTTRNMFNRPRAGDPVFRNGSVTGAGIENLQRQGVIFLMCNNALQAWVSFLSGSGTRGNPSEIDRELRANLLPGVVIVPAMVIAIEKAQGAGLAYNRQ